MARLLVVDDDEGTLAWMTTALTRAGHDVRAVSRARAALELVRSFRPDLAILDILMPEMDGVALARALHRRAAVPVMFVSIAGREAEAILRGAAGYVAKPIVARELRDAVDRVLGRAAEAVTILVVDDDPSVTEVYRMILEPRFRVIAAANGRDALSVLEREAVALALVDVHMPVMNGVDLVRALRADPRWRALPVIVQTSDTASLRAPVWVDLQVDQVMNKDVFLEWLLAQVDSHTAEAEPGAVP
jgi:CheY-like chemotaxis protein